jgi:hypothetical protein
MQPKAMTGFKQKMEIYMQALGQEALCITTSKNLSSGKSQYLDL